MDKIGRKIYNSTVIVGDFISPFSGAGMDGTKQKINKEIEDFNTNELDLTNIYKTLHPTLAEYIFVSVKKLSRERQICFESTHQFPGTKNFIPQCL